MKTFRQKLQEWNDVDAGSVEDSSIGVHNIQDSEVLSRVNAFVGALADREYINPCAAINNLQQNLHRIGLDFKEQIESLNKLHKPGANDRMKGVCSLVPIRSIGNSANIVEYNNKELRYLQNQ